MRFLLLVLLAGTIIAGEFTPRHLCLTCEGDGDRTITINCLEPEPGPGTVLQARYDTVVHDDPLAFPHLVTGTMHRIPGLKDGRAIHWLRLDGLEPGTTCHAVVGDAARGWSRPFSFRTLPADDRPLRFISGGDLGPWEPVDALAREAAKRDPAFICLGGDLFYENGELAGVDRVDGMLERLLPNLRAPDGRLIPMILAIGNHEVRGHFGKTAAEAPFYHGLFAQGLRPATYRRAIGANAVLYVLDTNHVTPVGGDQTAWLANQFKLDEDRRWKFALYHVPLYPSNRAFEPNSEAMRMWRPLFDQNHLTAAFENHDHTFKRTRPMRNGVEDAHGTIYLGDGCWGVRSRPVDATRPYLAKAASLNHLWEVSVSRERVEYRAFLADGRVFDVWPADADGAAAAEVVWAEVKDRRPVAK